MIWPLYIQNNFVVSGQKHKVWVLVFLVFLASGNSASHHPQHFKIFQEYHQSANKFWPDIRLVLSGEQFEPNVGPDMDQNVWHSDGIPKRFFNP